MRHLLSHRPLERKKADLHVTPIQDIQPIINSTNNVSYMGD
jgi:hypothetical protein